MAKFFPLHVHTHDSLLLSPSKPKQIAKRCKELGYGGSAITDGGSISGCIKFAQEMEKNKLKPIFGQQINMVYHDASDRTNKDKRVSHSVVLAKNFNGWKNLIGLTSKANSPEFFYYQPRLTVEELAIHSQDLICMSGCIGSDIANKMFKEAHLPYTCRTESEVMQSVSSTWATDCEELVLRYKQIFGENFYLSVNLNDYNALPAQSLITKGVRWLGKKLGVPCIATPQSYYCTEYDADDQRILLCTKLKMTLKDLQTKKVDWSEIDISSFFKSNKYYIPSEQELSVYTDEELLNTLRVSDKCETYKVTSPPIIPRFTAPDGISSKEYLRKVCQKGFLQLMPRIKDVMKRKSLTMEDYGKRFEHEYEVLTSVSLEDYFLIVWDIVEYAKRDGQLIGAGRGSAAGSLILFLLTVTDVDPLEFDLLFERFYNAGRNTPGNVAMPDVDLDFEKHSRGKIIDYIKSKYGSDKVAQLCTFGRLQGRSVLKDVMRAHGACSNDEQNQITEFVPDEAKITDKLEEMREADKLAGGDGEASIIEWSLENHVEELKPWAYYDEGGNIQGPMGKIFEQAIRLEGTKRQRGLHASGIVLTNEPIHEICPIVYEGGDLVSGFEMSDMEAIGQVKFDILGLSCLDKLHNLFDLLRTGEMSI